MRNQNISTNISTKQNTAVEAVAVHVPQTLSGNRCSNDNLITAFLLCNSCSTNDLQLTTSQSLAITLIYNTRPMLDNLPDNYLRRVRSKCCEVRADCVEARGCTGGGNDTGWHGGSALDCRGGSAAAWWELHGRGSDWLAYVKCSATDGTFGVSISADILRLFLGGPSSFESTYARHTSYHVILMKNKNKIKETVTSSQELIPDRQTPI